MLRRCRPRIGCGLGSPRLRLKPISPYRAGRAFPCPLPFPASPGPAPAPGDRAGVWPTGPGPGPAGRRARPETGEGPEGGQGGGPQLGDRSGCPTAQNPSCFPPSENETLGNESPLPVHTHPSLPHRTRPLRGLRPGRSLCLGRSCRHHVSSISCGEKPPRPVFPTVPHPSPCTSWCGGRLPAARAL